MAGGGGVGLGVLRSGVDFLGTGDRQRVKCVVISWIYHSSCAKMGKNEGQARRESVRVLKYNQHPLLLPKRANDTSSF